MKTTRREFLRGLGLGAVGIGLAGTSGCCTRMRPALLDSMLPRSPPDLQGVDPRGLLAFLDAAAERKIELHSLMVVRNGFVVAEGWWKPYGRDLVHTLYSLSKSFTSTAVGLAAAEGRLTVNDRVVDFFPDDRPATVAGNLAALRIRDLLTMASGHEKEPTWDMVRTDNWVKHFLGAPITHEPGSVFMYNSGATYLCSAIVQKVTGQRIVDYLRPRLFEPLGIDRFTWETCPQGINTGGWGLSVQTESLAKFALLYLNQGRWAGRQLLPAAWVAEATSKQIQQPFPAKPGRPNEQNDWVQGYGYQFWRCTNGGFRGDGAFGQFAIVLPEKSAVVIMTAESNNLQGQLDLVWKHLLPAMQDRADGSAQAELDRRLAALELPMRPAGTARAPFDARTFALETNELGLRSVTIDAKRGDLLFRDDRGEHRLSEAGGTTALPGTPPRLVGGYNSTRGQPFRYAAGGAWKDDRTFELLVRYIETPHHDTITCRFDGDGVEMSFMNSIAAMGTNPKDSRPVLRGRVAVT